MIALITDSKVILYITLGIPVLLGLIAVGAALDPPQAVRARRWAPRGKP